MSTQSERMLGGSEDQEALMFHSYPYAYYVQSPSTVSHANSADIRNQTTGSSFHSPTRSETASLTKNPEVSTFTLSRYSSSRGSNNDSFLHDNKISITVAGGAEKGVNRLIIIDHHGAGGGDDDEEDDEEDDDNNGEFYGRKKRGCWWRYFSFRRSNSCAWISLQIAWRLTLSLGVALLVFYIATKPPPPEISIKMVGIRQFALGEGVDAHGVTTKILTCNCSVNLLIENRSKIFGLHVRPPILEMSFGRFPFAMSRGPRLYAESHESTSFELFIGTKNKPMYGAGRSMEDMLESGSGLPIVIRMSLSSNFRVVWSFIKPKFHHQAECLIVLDSAYDKKHHTQAYNSSCLITV